MHLCKKKKEEKLNFRKQSHHRETRTTCKRECQKEKKVSIFDSKFIGLGIDGVVVIGIH